MRTYSLTIIPLTSLCFQLVLWWKSSLSKFCLEPNLNHEKWVADCFWIWVGYQYCVVHTVKTEVGVTKISKIDFVFKTKSERNSVLFLFLSLWWNWKLILNLHNRGNLNLLPRKKVYCLRCGCPYLIQSCPLSNQCILSLPFVFVSSAVLICCFIPPGTPLKFTPAHVDSSFCHCYWNLIGR